MRTDGPPSARISRRRAACFAIAFAAVAGCGQVPALEAVPPPRAAAASPVSTLEELIDRMEALSAGSAIRRLGWRVFSQSGGRDITQEDGLEVLGRFERGQGIRTVTTTLACADATTESRQPGPNHVVAVYATDHTAVATIMLLLETPNPASAFPYLLFRSHRGEPGHLEIDPLMVPATAENGFYAGDEIAAFQLAPRIMFGHLPGLKMEGRRPFGGVECIVVSSQRDAGPASRGPAVWNTCIQLVRRLYIDARTLAIVAIDYRVTNAGAGPSQAGTRDFWVAEVKSRRRVGAAPGLELPERVDMRGFGAEHGGSTTSAERVSFKTLQYQDDTFS